MGDDSLSGQLRSIIWATMERRGITSYRVAKDTGIAESTLSRFFRGERWMSEANLNTIARYLDLTIYA